MIFYTFDAETTAEDAAESADDSKPEKQDV